jgi:hypothetical protein
MILIEDVCQKRGHLQQHALFGTTDDPQHDARRLEYEYAKNSRGTRMLAKDSL